MENERVDDLIQKSIDVPREKMIVEYAAENNLLKSFLYCTKRSCNNCGKVTCENFQRQRVDCCGHWVSYKDYIVQLEKENAELKEQLSYLKDNLRVARKDREDLQLDVAKGLKEFVKDFPATAIRYLANEKYVEQITEAKEILEMVIDSYNHKERFSFEKDLAKAEQFLKEVE